ncbi:uncharacterized protein LOC131650039 [Vicia villosa]|uniref:uncharacterized protein LOC131650037 n=1 Tax=Vicia villosa TaxID=3911 RepID=UPI00273B3D3E|nr:uncharacterized protein LOC131650037 [Vicia villosa]XP_058775763.1 uncharacterized protein LOC131650039 [Vicia villosa]
MNIVSYNIRGGGNPLKQRRIKECLMKGKADLCFLQETKIKSISGKIVNSLWSDCGVEWSAHDSRGQSGGLLIMWKMDVFSPVFSFGGTGLIGICGNFGGKQCFFVNVYSPCDLLSKRKLWEDLLSLRSKWGGGEWCLGGDFNTVRFPSEHIGRSNSQRSQDSHEFNDFIGLMNLIDLPTSHRKFTWCKGGVGGAMRRIDRFLLSDGMVSLLCADCQVVGRKDISDHSPIWLDCNSQNWGPKPFRTLNTWPEHPGLVEFVDKEWKALRIKGSCAFVVKEKFRCLKESLRS